MPQDHNSTSSWPRHMHQDSLGMNMEDEDFTKFLDLEDSFEQFQQIDGSHASSSLETPMGRLAFGHESIQALAGHGSDVAQNINVSSYQPYQMYSQMAPSHHYNVPPTPVSAEMHGAKYSGQIDPTGQILFDRHQASFTPLVSPAQTPLEHAFSMPDYVMADEFFSPLTSPAIEAQQKFASTNTTASPVDFTNDNSASSTPGPSVRKRGRKANLPQQRLDRSVKQSPVAKPHQKKRQFSLSSGSQDKLEAMLESTAKEDLLQPSVVRGNIPANSNDSVSPEPLAEALMRPPPLPLSIGRSPSNLQSQTTDPSLPATPAMIMRMHSKQSTPVQKANDQVLTWDNMEDIALPNAATALPTDSPLQGDVQDDNIDNQTTPTLPAKTLKLNADSTPRYAVAKTQNNSNESVDKIKRPDTRLGGRGSKKRPSNSSNAISPALRPKISPSISPLAPATAQGLTGLNPETSALYLASKSNYQNILDGTHLPGVSYPETLAENLSSKRTSHKIAEQGRRNRINVALKEIESLLPASILAGTKKDKVGSNSKEGEDESIDKSGSTGQGASKASTVEMAIVYIKSLQTELKDTQDKLAMLEKEVGKSSASSSPTAE